MKISGRELRIRTKEVLSAAERGERVIISSRGKACAKITAIDSKADRVKEPDAAYGMWKTHKNKRSVKGCLKQLQTALMQALIGGSSSNA